MGTLTADVPRLAQHCPHKLATSCRLTSTPRCCACADHRGHSLSYAVYVDGVGFVQRGTRWQNYCWFCKTFWDNRVAAASLAPSQTKIPEVPDQTEFLDRWFEFHQGYRTVKTLGGQDQRIAVVGEPLRDVSPGELPRTLEQLRAGAARDEITASNWAPFASEEFTNFQSLDDALDELLNQDTEQQQTPTSDSRQSDATPTASAPMMNAVPAIAAPAATSTSPGNLSTINSDSPALSAEAARQARRMAAFTRVWGSREEFQSPEYVSPVAGLFNSAWARHRNLEDLRRAQQSADPARMEQALSNIERDAPAWYATPQAQAALADSLGINSDGSNTAADRESRLSNMERAVGLLARLRGQNIEVHPHLSGLSEGNDSNAVGGVASWVSHEDDDIVDEEPEFLGLDGDDRPPPLSEAELSVKLECKVCLTQRANVACLPCGHLGLCGWCADQAIPAHPNDKTRPQDKFAKCPMCRKRIKQRVQIFVP